MAKEMKKWLKKFEDVMVSASFAEAGEFETARETLKEKRTILLALTGEKSDIHALRYAINICKRIGAVLEILSTSGQEKNREKQLLAELKREGIIYHFYKKPGCIKDEILNYTNRKKEILFVVIESPEGLNVNCKKPQKGLSGLWQNLKCPLVLVSGYSQA
jgi:hypothetical protein